MARRADPTTRNLMLDAFRTTGNWYLRLFTAARNDDGTGGTELTGNGYAGGVQVPMANAASNGILSNSGDVTFPSATGTVGTVSHGVIADTATGAIGKGWNVEINPPVVWQSGQAAVIATGQIKLDLNV